MKINVYGEHIGAKAKPSISIRLSKGTKYVGVVIPLKGTHNAITFWARAIPKDVVALRNLLDDAAATVDEYSDSEFSRQ